MLISSGVDGTTRSTSALAQNTSATPGARSANPRASVLIVDDDASVRSTLRERLVGEGYAVAEAGTGAQAREELARGHDLVLLADRLPDAEGLVLLRETKSSSPDTPVIFLASLGAPAPVDATVAGAFYFVMKPVLAEQVTVLVARALQTKRLERDLQELLACNGAPRSAGQGRMLELPPAGVDVEKLVANLVMQALVRTRGNKTRAAALLGMTRDQIRYRIEKYAIGSGNGSTGTTHASTQPVVEWR